MKVLKTIAEYKDYQKLIENNSVGFVATMGALHDGHISLAKRSLKDNDVTVVSIYVNTTQFDQQTDLDNYPNTINNDLDVLKKLGVNAVFMPDYNQMYPDNYRYQLQEKHFSNRLCGAHRDGHFDGVLTVVMKLFNIIQPKKAYFGKKDYQQLRLIQGMVEAFYMDVEVIGCPIIRELDGLAMSSRNLRLTTKQRSKAVELYKTLTSDRTIEQMHQHLTNVGFEVDYIEEMNGRLLAAASLGEIRLIDNVVYPQS